MKRVLFLGVLFLNLSVWALVAPERYMIDKNCPKEAPFKRAGWENYKDKEGGYYVPYGDCISCDTTKGLMLVDEKDCEICPNRTTQGINDLLSKSQCRLKKCPKDRPFYEEKWNWSGCKSCADRPTHISKEECLQCVNMRWVDGLDLCAPDVKGVMYYDGAVMDKTGREMRLVGGMLPYSYSCKNDRNELAVKTGKSECSQCPDTIFKNGWCYLNKQGK